MDSHEPASAPAEHANAPIGTSGLPQLDDRKFEPLDPAYVRARTLAAAAVAGCLAIAAVVAALAAGSVVPLAFGGAALLVVAAVGWLHRFEIAHMGYLVREHDVSFRSGVIARSVATAPFARVQHVSIERGPVDRRFGLARLQVRTAGGQIAIPGLSDEVAERLKQLVADRAGELADAEIEADAP